jgi:signal transduction histidine kinase
MDVDGAGIAELPPSGDDFQVRAALTPPGYDGPTTATLPVAPRSPAVAALDSRQPVIVDDWQAQGRFEPSASEVAAGARSSIAIPIGGRGRPYGVLGAVSRRPGAFAPDDSAFLQALANVLADAVERRQGEAEVAALSAARGRLVAQALEAEERARRTISEALHDGPLQDLLAALAGRGGDEEALAHARERLGGVVGQLREVMGALHPTVLQYGGIEAALHAIAEQHASSAGFETEISVDPAAAGVRDELLAAVARELITNVAKHAGAGHVGVRLAVEDGALTLEVADDGSGLDTERARAALRHGHIGLASCRERMEAVGGELTLSDTPGGGTTAIARAPVSPDEHPDRTARVAGLADNPYRG